MRALVQKAITGFGTATAFSVLLFQAASCTDEPGSGTSQPNGSSGGKSGGSGGSSLQGGQTGGSSTAGSGGSTGMSSASGGAAGTSTAAGGGGGKTDIMTSVDSGAGGSNSDAPIGVAVPPDAPPFEVNFKMPKTNFTEYKPKFDPVTVPGIQPLFDGETLSGWSCSKDWSVKDGTITAGPGYWGFCPSAGTYDKFRWFASIIQDGTEGDGGHTGMGVDGTPFYDLMTPSCVFWDYAANVGIEASNKCVRLDLAGGKTKTSPDQVYWHGEWFQVEMLVDLTKGTVRAALNGTEIADHTFKPKSGGKPAPIGVRGHNGGAVRYKDLWIEVNPKEPDKLLSAAK